MAQNFENSRLLHYAWQSEDDSIWPEWSYLYWEDVETKRFAKFVELWKKPINLLDDAELWSSSMKLWASTPNPLWWENIFFLWNDWKIFNEDKILVYTDSTENDLEYHSFSISDTYYYTSNLWSSSAPLRLNSILHANIDNSWTVNEDILNWDDLELIERWNSWYHRFLVVWTIAYISSGNKIAKFNHNTQEIEAQFDFFPSDIIWISYWSWNIKVFLKNWLLYIWDWVNEEQPLEIINLSEKLENARTIWAIDYVIGGDFWDLARFFALDWYRLSQINKKQRSRLLWINKFDVSTTWNFQNIESSDNQIFLLDRESWNDRIASYWNKIRWLSKWYTVDLTKASNWNIISWSIDFLFQTQWKLFYWYNNWTWDRWVEYINLEQSEWPYIEEWFIIEQLFDWWDIIKVKKEEKFYWKCEIPEWTSIEIQSSVNWKDFVSCDIITDAKVLNNWLFTLSDQSFSAWTNYRENTYKIILRTTDSDVTPRWYWFKTLYSFTD